METVVASFLHVGPDVHKESIDIADEALRDPLRSRKNAVREQRKARHRMRALLRPAGHQIAQRLFEPDDEPSTRKAGHPQDRQRPD